jgi:ABC-type dipeptide/oligopeptide/nickel transport system permease component
MLQFAFRRIIFILLVCVFIVFSVHLGMRMIRNSETQEPNYDLLIQGQLAWGDTRGYLSRAQNGNFGAVRETHGLVPVIDILRTAYINSMGLLIVALAGGAIAGLAIGSFAALTRHKRILIPLLSLTILGISTPSFFAGLLLRQGELAYLRIFGRPLVSMAGFGWDYQHMLMPVLVLAARPLAYLTRTAYLALRRVMTEDYIRTAYAKGLSQRRTVNVHALRNFSIPVLTAVGVSLRFSLSTLPIVEFLFAWPGMGLRLLEAIDARQTAVVATLAAAMGLTFLLLNFFLDLAYRIIDPRLRSAENE